MSGKAYEERPLLAPIARGREIRQDQCKEWVELSQFQNSSERNKPSWVGWVVFSSTHALFKINH
jgi:hypothetical protein